MQNSVLVRVMHGAGDLRDQFRGLADRHRRAFYDLVKLSAFHELHAEVAGAVALADFVDWNDPGMLQLRCRFGLQTKAL